MDEPDNLENEIDEQGRNLTQQRIDEEGAGDAPVDAPWEAEDAPEE
jgi:hypothetical protein